MKLHLDKTLFRQVIQFTSQELRILPIYVEKDYWVTFALHTLFNSEISDEIVFKGGTALSKCYKMIERFSEDIDLVVLRKEGESNKQLTRKIKATGDIIGNVLPEVEIDGITRKMGMNRKTAHSYHKEFQGDHGQVRDVIIVEATWLGYFEPYTTRQLNSLVSETMLRNSQYELAKQHGLLPFDVRVLEPVRTLCEKIMSLVRFSYGEHPMENLKNKIRHTYDLHQLLQAVDIFHFFHSTDFDKMLLKVANDDVVSFKNNNKWLANHPSQALIFSDLDSVWKELVVIYNGPFRTLVYGNLPNGESILSTLQLVQKRLKEISWSIRIDMDK